MPNEDNKTGAQSMAEVIAEFQKNLDIQEVGEPEHIASEALVKSDEPIVKLEGSGKETDETIRKSVESINKCLFTLRKANEDMARRLNLHNVQNKGLAEALSKAASTSEVKSLADRLDEEIKQIDESLKNYRVQQAYSKSEDKDKTVLDLYSKALRAYLLQRSSSSDYKKYSLTDSEIAFVKSYTGSNFQEFEKAASAATHNAGEIMTLWNTPPDAFGRIVDVNASEYSEVWKMAAQWNTDNKAVKIDTQNYKPEVYWIEAVGEVPTDSAKAAGTVTIKASALGVSFTVDRESLTDSGYNLLDLITNGYAKRMAEKMEDGFWNGTQPYEPQGILTSDDVPVFANGEVQTITNLNAFRLIPTQIKDVYAKNDRQAFFMNRKTWGEISLCTDGVGNYLLNYNKDRESWLINGYPVIQVHSLPNIAANSTPIVFGDIKESYMVVRQKGKKMFLTDSVTLMNQLRIKYMFTDSMGGGIFNPEPLIKMKIATS
jgi:HK97 family phage major capsid protein